MPENWKTYRLEDLTTRITVGFVGSMAQEYVEDGIPMLRSQNIKPFCLDYGNLKYISPKFHEKIRKSSLKKDDVAIVRTGNPGTACVIPEGIPDLNCSDLVIATPDKSKIDPHFLSFYFNSIARNYISSELVGAVQQHFNVSSAKKMEIKLPEIEEQYKIVSILKGIQDKIDLNLQMNETLEEMAMALYKHWFVDFGPFLDGEFIDVEFFGINRPLNIPEKFEVVNLKGIINRFKSKNKYNQKNVFPEGKVRVFDQSSSRILGFHNNEPDFEVTSNIPFLIFGDHTCRMELVSENFSVGPNLIPFKPKNFELTYLMYLGLVDKVKMNDYKRHWSELMLHQLVIPKDLNVVKKFNVQVRDNFNLIYQNEIQNQTLTKLRDTLLPKLISGEVRVKDVEKTLSEVL
ncbi:restriction endonuclease subunit S [Salegentibacter sp. Hel_I_6]|uniref:restriction endonuclease subunit S n=1 Tax=Salegentibacter sp. Hel_I_6 TaxID=1250278 RepID=UPI00068DEB05|nr:restriction endonuclease subunit S [Salegentibacter sp. Hel_I_6]